jgi:predicted amidohydrolase YtcJ
MGRIIKNLLLVILAILIVSAAIFAGFRLYRPAKSFVLVNCTAYQVVPRGGIAEAIAVEKGIIKYAGSSKGAEPYIKKGLKVIDLNGAFVLPGFHDSHTHVLEGGIAQQYCNLDSLDGIKEYEAAIKDYAAKNPKMAWVAGMGWTNDMFPDSNPQKEDLDRLVPDRPAAMMCEDGHNMWVNSLALKEAGITKDTPDPPEGRIERNAAGEPSGTLRESALDLVMDRAFNPSVFEVIKGLKRGIYDGNSKGITSMMEGRTTIDEYYDMAFKVTHFLFGLNARITMAFYVDPKRKDDEQIKEIIGKFSNDPASMLKGDCVKFFIDGVPETRTGWFFAPYECKGKKEGIPNFRTDRLFKLVEAFDKAGFQVEMHACGDRAINEGLNAVENAIRKNGPGDRRHQLVHVYLVRPEDMQRFRELGVYASIQPYWACAMPFNTKINLPNLGKERYDRLFPFETLNKNGCMLAGGSDYSVDPMDPLTDIQTAVTRQEPAKPADMPVFNASERIDLVTAIEAYTINGAKLAHREKLVGSIEPGKLADFVILEKNLFNIPEYDIYRTKVIATLLEGKPVFLSTKGKGMFMN